MDVRFINPFLEGAKNVLGTMAQVELTPGKPYIKNGEEACGDVTAILGLSGQVNGSLSVSFSYELIRAVLEKMLGEEIDEINSDVKDAVGELTNMISGDARRLLSQQGLNLKAGIPTVISGQNHTVKHITKGRVIAIPFHAGAGLVTIEIALES
jgi:chemotaxis protein CheX